MWTPKPGLVPLSICLVNPCQSPLRSAQGYETASFDRSLHPGKRSMDILTPPGILPLNLFQDLRSQLGTDNVPILHDVALEQIYLGFPGLS